MVSLKFLASQNEELQSLRKDQHRLMQAEITYHTARNCMLSLTVALAATSPDGGRFLDNKY